MTSTATAPRLPHWGTRFYDREVWMVGAGVDNDELWCTFIQGTDRRSYAALNRYLRDGDAPALLRPQGLRRLLPRVGTAWLLFTAAGDLDRWDFHHQIDEPGALQVLVIDS